MDSSTQRVLVRLLAVVLAIVAALFGVDALGLAMASDTMAVELILTLLAALIPAGMAAVLWFQPDLVTEGVLEDEPSTLFTAVKEAALVRVGCTVVGLFCLVDGVTTLLRWGVVIVDLGDLGGVSTEVSLLVKGLVPMALGLGLIYGRQTISQIYYQGQEAA